MRNPGGGMLLFLSFALLLTGCSARRVLVGTAPVASAASVALLPSANRDVEYLSSALKMSASIGNESLSVKGKLRVKENEGVQISATALGLMEAACLEFLPYTVKFIYKIDRMYAEAPYALLPFMSDTGTGYTILESVILNRMFSPDGTPFRKAVKSMRIVDEGDYITVTTSADNPVVYKFYIDKSNGNLVRSEGVHSGGGSVVCRYSDFTDFNGTPFPRMVELSFSSDVTSASLLLRMSSLKNDKFVFSPRKVSKAYKRVSLDGIVESVGEIE